MLRISFIAENDRLPLAGMKARTRLAIGHNRIERMLHAVRRP